jgi:predicted metal-dependent enzyme (double-stranded beta helix superfamily)
MMRAASMARQNPALAQLIKGLDSACEGSADALGTAVSQALRLVCADSTLLTPHQCRGHDDRYARHLVHADAAGRYAVVALVWGSGHVTPVHGHYTWCGYVVQSGRLSEENYVWAHEAKAAQLMGSVDRQPGDVHFSHAGLEAIHRLHNASDAPAVSIHVYGIDGRRVATHVNRVVAGVESVAA